MKKWPWLKENICLSWKKRRSRIHWRCVKRLLTMLIYMMWHWWLKTILIYLKKCTLSTDLPSNECARSFNSFSFAAWYIDNSSDINWTVSIDLLHNSILQMGLAIVSLVGKNLARDGKAWKTSAKCRSQRDGDSQSNRTVQLRDFRIIFEVDLVGNQSSRK